MLKGAWGLYKVCSVTMVTALRPIGEKKQSKNVRSVSKRGNHNVVLVF